MPRFSFIIPVYNRPQEVMELLESMHALDAHDFEVIIVEDGSDNDCKVLIETFRADFPIYYFYKNNDGPGPTRNFGAKEAKGEWFIFLDSDTLLPEGYLEAVESFVNTHTVDAFGGADRDRVDFSPVQKAISYSMTSFFTTGGIRGSQKSLEKFKPRSFNMGIRREVFHTLNGFSEMRYGEDIDFSLRITYAGYVTAYIPEAYVYHKRRTSFSAFFRQVKHSGEARILLSKRHKGSLKLIHVFPSVFVVGVLLSVFLFFISKTLASVTLLFYVFYSMMLWIDATLKTRSLAIGFLSLVASYVQFFGYGVGFLKAGMVAILNRRKRSE